MELTATHRDALTELISIGYGRAAGSLSQLTGHRVQLEVPRITMHRIEELAAVLARLVDGECATVNQVFSGPISGTALLLLDERSAQVLSGLLRDDKAMLGGIDADGREIVTEVGNILLNACLGVFGNLLQVRVTFAVPRLTVSDVGRVLESIRVGSEELQHGLMIHTRFHLRESNVTGYLVIVLGITSLDRMLHELDGWAVRQSTN